LPEQEETDPFEELEEPKNQGSSEKPQNPFRKSNGQFGNGGGNIAKTSSHGKIDSSKYKPVEFPKEEYARVIHELNTNLTQEQRKKKQITRAIGSTVYTIENNGFNEYRIIDKYKSKLVKTHAGEKLFNMLQNIWNDEHFIVGVLGGLRTDEQKQKLIDILKDGETDTDQIILIALDIRNGEI